MRLSIRLLNSNCSLNSQRDAVNISFARGENLDVYFQLVDLDENKIRYIPTTGATVMVSIPRLVEVIPLPSEQRQTVDNSFLRPAMNPFADDRSIWKVSFLPSETKNMISNSIKITLTDGSVQRIASLNSALRVLDNQDQ